MLTEHGLIVCRTQHSMDRCLTLQLLSTPVIPLSRGVAVRQDCAAHERHDDRERVQPVELGSCSCCECESPGGDLPERDVMAYTALPA